MCVYSNSTIPLQGTRLALDSSSYPASYYWFHAILTLPISFFHWLTLYCVIVLQASNISQTPTILTLGRREIWIQTFAFVNCLFTTKLYCLRIISLLNLPCNHGDTEIKCWEIRTTCIWFLEYTTMPSYFPKGFDSLSGFLDPTITA